MQDLDVHLWVLVHSQRTDHLDQKGQFWSRINIAGTKVIKIKLSFLIPHLKFWLILDFCFFFLVVTEANMLYLETPVGVGFSYSTQSSSYESVNDKITG